MPTMVDTDVALRLIQGKPWHHDFEIIPGVRTNGSYDPLEMWNELQLPEDLRGTSLADIGASNGFFSFEARRRGARVVAFDFRHKDNSGFGLAQHINGLTDIDHHYVNVLDLSAETYGQFDVVLALGLLYHTADPYRALSNCAALAGTRLILESYCLDLTLPETLRGEPLMRFMLDPARFPAGAHLNNDRSNFWGFTSACLQRMVEDLGFVATRTHVRGDRVFMDAQRGEPLAGESRLSIAYDCLPPTLAGANRDDPAAWTIF